MKHQIKHRFTDAVLFECDIPESMESGMAVRHALEKAAASGANLDGANLTRAYLVGANLDGANLTRAYLVGANLDGANLSNSNLDGANLTRAYMVGANLDGANLTGAKLKNGEILIGNRPIFMVGPIGSRCDYLIAYITDRGLRFDAGCHRQITREKFEGLLSELHGDNQHTKEYRAALMLIDAHAEIWTPKE